MLTVILLLGIGFGAEVSIWWTVWTILADILLFDLKGTVKRTENTYNFAPKNHKEEANVRPIR